MAPSPVDPTNSYTPEQKQALAKLHDAATQFEGVFLEMVMNAMQDTVPQQTLFGTDDSAEQTWQSMLNDERAEAMAKDGGFGLAEQLENQLRGAVLGDAGHEAKVDVDKRIEP
ncbi:MAG TPA: rod-binding protein [Candidatus Acidoferrales bacterium]|nr:rod-binding protein [Candidatus Acidoferrales bacterium]